jgi:hypothetical protein
MTQFSISVVWLWSLFQTTALDALYLNVAVKVCGKLRVNLDVISFDLGVSKDQ